MPHPILSIATRLLAASLVILAPIRTADAQSAQALVEASAESMGGLDRLRELRSVAYSARGHEFVLGAFETTEGPQPVEYDDITEVRDFAAGARSLTKTVILAETPGGRTMTIAVRDSVAEMTLPLPEGGTRRVPGRSMMVDDARKTLALSPERILLTALGAPDLQRRPDTTIAGAPVRRLSFTWSHYDVDLFLEASTLLIHRIETRTTTESDFSWRMWPEVVERTTYYYWANDPFGIRYPRQWDVTRNGIPYRSVLVTELTLSDEPPADAIVIGTEVRTAFAGMAAMGPPHSYTEIVPGIGTVSGTFQSLLVRQGASVVVIETPVWPEETNEVMAAVDTLFDGARIDAGVIGAGAITQYGGVAAFERIDGPVYGSPIHRRLIDRIAPGVDYRSVTAPIKIGTGPNRFTLYPALGDQGRSTLLVWFPEHRLLYGSSLLIPERFAPLHHEQRVFEVRRVIERHGLDVDRVFGMYLPLTAWNEYGT